MARLGVDLTEAVAHADPDIWKAIVIAAAVSAGGLWLFLAGLAKSRSISAIPRSLLRSAAQGYVELHGQTGQLPGSSITATLSRRPCVWFSFAVERRTRDSKGNSRWTTVDSGRSDERFELRDETGHCIVDPRGAEVITSRQDRWYGDSSTPAHGPDAQRQWWRSGAYRYTERRIEEQAALFVWGNFRTETLNAGSNERVNALLRAWKADQATLIERFDANRDGVIDGDEWSRARQTAIGEASVGSSAGPSTMNLVERPAEADRPYILSTQSESTLLRGYRIQMATGIAMFLLGGAACIWMVGARMGS